MNKPTIIGVTGSFGSGCSYIIDEILVPRGYKKHSLSTALKKMFRKEKKRDPEKASRHKLQDFGDEKRQKKRPDFFARDVLQKIGDEIKKGQCEKFAIDSIRNPAEIYAFRKTYAADFFVFGIYADKEIRWERNRNHEYYKGNRSPFDEDDARDKGDDSPEYGQRVGACFSESDIVLSNNQHFETTGNEAFKEYEKKVLDYVSLIEDPLSGRLPLKGDEPFMAAAYACSQESTCLKRKVGAIVVDSSGSIISSGRNDVPRDSRSCSSVYGKCYKDYFREQFVESAINEKLITKNKKQGFIKLLKDKIGLHDICQAVHAEENVILNLTRTGSMVPLETCTLYTTTYPCRQCARRIVNPRISEVASV